MMDLSTKRIVITGATDGLGKLVARDLAEEGAGVILHGRDPEKGRRVLEELRAATGSDALSYVNADFAALDEIRAMADAIAADHDRIDVLVNNAGIGFGAPGSGRETSRDGYELRFQVNYLSGFLLTSRLLPLLRHPPSARIVNVASAAQQAIDFEDVMLEADYSGHRAYSQSKLAQILFTVELAERLADTSITVNALHPATYMDTNMVHEAGLTPANSVQKGADAVEHLIADSEPAATTGAYFNGRTPTRAAGQAYDADARQRLWSLSERLTGEDFQQL
ncbi:MAG: SDR family NAD(P)-dependent oxidoreductase [Rhodothermales bacterium]